MKWDRGRPEPGGEDKIWNEEKHGGGRKTEIGGKGEIKTNGEGNNAGQIN